MTALTMSTELCRHAGVAGALTVAEKIGFRSVELIPHMFGAKHGKLPIAADDAEVASLHAALKAHGLRAAVANAVFMPYSETWPEEPQFIPPAMKDMVPRASPAEYAGYLIWLTRIARTLGIQTINCLTMPFTGQTPEETLGRFVEGMRPVLASAHDHGVIVCVEHEAMCALIRFEPGLRSLMTAIDHPAFGLTIDTSNLFTSGIEPYPYAYRELKPWIKHIHLRGARLSRDEDTPEFKAMPMMRPARPGQYNTFTSLRDGAVNVHGLLASLVADGYRGIVTLQPLARGAGLGELPRILADDVAFVGDAFAA